MEKILYVGQDQAFRSKITQALMHEKVPEGGTIIDVRTALKVFCKTVTRVGFPMISLAETEHDISFHEDIPSGANYVRTQKVYYDKTPQLVLIDIDIEPSRELDEAQCALARRHFGYNGQNPAVTFLMTKHKKTWSPKDWGYDKKRGFYLFPKSIHTAALIKAAHTLLEKKNQLQKTG